MKCLITGSEGFIGKNLVSRLKEGGHEVVGLDCGYGLEYEEEGDFLKYSSEGTLKESRAFVGHLEGFDVIFHLACVNQMQATLHGRRNLEVNAWGTRMMALAAERMGARFIYTSTASVYGNAQQIPTPKDARLVPITDYAVAKLAGEFFVQNSGADWTILRLSNVYGPHQTPENPYCGVIGRFIDQARAGEPLTVIGSGHQTRDFTYVGDVVQMLIGIGLSGSRLYSERVYNVSHGREVTVLEVAQRVAETFGVPFWENLRHIEPRPIDGVSRRCLIPDLKCRTDLGGGILKTKEWYDAS